MSDQDDPEGLAKAMSMVRSALVDELGVDRDAITPEARLQEDLELSSLDVIELLVMLEEQAGVTLGTEVAPEPENVATVAALATLVSQLSAGVSRP